MINIIAHRGANKQAPQNTIPAFRRAIELKADGFENDVHLTKDGVIVICHNYEIDATSTRTSIINTYAEEALLADAIADLAFAQAEHLTLVTPSNPQADDRERAMVYIVAVYTLFALTLHQRTDFAVLFLKAWDNFNSFASARVIRKHYDRSWNSRYESLFYPLG